VSGRLLLRLAVGLASALAALAGLVAVAGDVPGEKGALELLSSADALRSPARVVDQSTGSLPVAVLAALLVLVLVRLRRARDAVLTALFVAGAIAGNAVLKRVVRRPRPELLLLEDVSRYSFPSGHAAATAALALAVVLVTTGTRRLRAAVLAGGLFVVTAAAAQLLLARHYPSDVVAGWLWAAAWTTAVWGCWPRRPRLTHRRRRHGRNPSAADPEA